MREPDVRSPIGVWSAVLRDALLELSAEETVLRSSRLNECTYLVMVAILEPPGGVRRIRIYNSKHVVYII